MNDGRTSSKFSRVTSMLAGSFCAPSFVRGALSFTESSYLPKGRNPRARVENKDFCRQIVGLGWGIEAASWEPGMEGVPAGNDQQLADEGSTGAAHRGEPRAASQYGTHGGGGESERVGAMLRTDHGDEDSGGQREDATEDAGELADPWDAEHDEAGGGKDENEEGDSGGSSSGDEEVRQRHRPRSSKRLASCI